MAEMIVFPAKEGRGGPAGERGSPTPIVGKSVFASGNQFFEAQLSEF